jgi:hypothetical protein
MGVLAEAVSVVIRVATVETRLPGGIAEYARQSPNNTYCTDGQVCRVGFMSPADAQDHLEHLQSLGFSPPGRNGSPEVAIIDQDSGFLHPCDWLQLGRQGDVTVTWLRGTELTHFVAPPGWKPGSMQRISLQQLADDYDMVEVRDGVEIYRHRETGDMQYVGRPKLRAKRQWWQFWK